MKLTVLPNERFSCHSCTNCCRYWWHIQCLPGERERIERLARGLHRAKALDSPHEVAPEYGVTVQYEDDGTAVLTARLLAEQAAIVLAAVEVLSGFAIYKPVQLSWLAAAFGGYDSARFVHFAGLALLAVFAVGHVVMVALHPRALADIVTGGKPQ